MIALVLLGFLALQEPDLDALLKQLEDESIEVREKAVAALVEAGDKAEARLKKEFESAQGEVKGRLESILKAIDGARKLRAVLPPLRKVKLIAKSRPLKEVVQEFREKSGMTVALDPSGEDPVTVAIEDATPMEALDALCKAAGLGYACRAKSDFDRAKRTWTNLPESLRIGGTYQEFPRAFVSHYGIFASRLSVNSTTDFETTIRAANLQLALFWAEEVRPENVDIEVLAAVDDKGRSVKWEEKGSPSYSMSMSGSQRQAPQRRTEQIWLKPPEPDAARLTIRGRLKASYIVERKFVTFEAPLDTPDQVQDYDGVRFAVSGFKQTGNKIEFSIEVSGERQGAAPSSKWRIGGRSFDASLVSIKMNDASTARQGGYSGSGDGKKQTYRMTFHVGGDAKPAAIQVEVDGSLVEDIADFELKDVPLSK